MSDIERLQRLLARKTLWYRWEKLKLDVSEWWLALRDRRRR